MKKLFVFLLAFVSIQVVATEYVSLLNDDAEWNTLFISYPYFFQSAKTVEPQTYVLHGDTVIDNVEYRKFCMKLALDNETKYIYFGAIREEDKKIYYRGGGYFSNPTFNSGITKAKQANDCLSSIQYDFDEILLYDFNQKVGEFAHWGYGYNQIISEDSVLVRDTYRRRLFLSDNDQVVEGIGSVVNGLLSFVTPMLLCSDYYYGWLFNTYAVNAKILYDSHGSVTSSDYQTVYSHRKAYFQSDYNLIETLSIDSIKYNNDSVFFPARRIELVADQCYDLNGGGIAGKRIDLNNQWNFFYNADNDTIKIKINARLNESWTIFQQPFMTISATVTSWDTLTFMGVIDSVKTITLHVFDPTMKPTKHALENATIKISKQYGFIKMLNFTYFATDYYQSNFSETEFFTLIGLTNPELGVKNYRWFDVFDFQVDDEFHYIKSGFYAMPGGGSYENKRIVKITKRENFTDSIRYTEDITYLKKYNPNEDGEYVVEYKKFQHINCIHKYLEFDLDPGTPVFFGNNKSAHIYHSFNLVGEPDLYYYENGCWSKTVICDDVCNVTMYADGRGVIFQGSGCWVGSSYTQEEQVFYKKGDKTWGTPLVISDVKETLDASLLKVYFNAVNNIVTIEQNETKKCTFELLDVQGKVVLQEQLRELKQDVNVNELNAGLYFYRILIDGQLVKSGKIIKQ